MTGRWWSNNQRRKMYKNTKHDKEYKLPMCHLCDSCESNICVLTNKDVTQSVFGRNSPKICPKRN